AHREGLWARDQVADRDDRGLRRIPLDEVTAAELRRAVAEQPEGSRAVVPDELAVRARIHARVGPGLPGAAVAFENDVHALRRRRDVEEPRDGAGLIECAVDALAANVG